MSDPEAKVQGDFLLPTRIIFGGGRVAEIGDHTSHWGDRALIITDSGVLSSGALKPVEAALAAAEIAYGVFSGSNQLPDEDVIATVVARYAQDFDFLIAAGGGRCIDTAKAARLALGGCFGSRFGGDRGEGQGPCLLPPLVAVPTTPGSGSEINCDVTTHFGGRRDILSSPEYIPEVALYDPELTMLLPARVTAATGAGIMARSVDVLLQERFDPMADALAEDALRGCAQSLPSAVSRGRDLAARTGVMTAGLLGGVAAAKGRGAIVALGQALSSIAGVQHGVAQALVAPVLLETAGTDEARERVVRALDPTGPRDAAGALRRFFQQLGLPQTLQDVGVPPGMAGALVTLALEDWGDADGQTEHRRQLLSGVLAQLD